MTTLLSQFGVAGETVYGTPATPTRFFEFNSFGVKLATGRTESAAMRRGSRTQRTDRFEPYRMGASGPVEMDVTTQGFGFFLRHMLGSVSTAAAVDGLTTHTGSEGAIVGKSFTAQVNKPFHPAGTDQPHTYHGCKITGWEMGCDVEGVLTLTLNIDAEDEDTTTALATASYPSGARVFSWVGGAITIGGSQVEMKNFRVGAENTLDTDRRYLRGSSLKKEPTENGLRVYSWSGDVDHSSLANYDRFRSEASASTMAAIVGTFQGPVVEGGGSTVPQIEITIPAARFDQVDFDLSGPEGLMDSLAGVALDNSVDSPVSIAYRTVDVTP